MVLVGKQLRRIDMTWTDHLSDLRGHALLTQAELDALPAYGSNDENEKWREVLVQAKLFSPYMGWTWYLTEFDPSDGIAFGLVDGFEKEMGSFHVDELRDWVRGGVPVVERDCHWTPVPIGSLLDW